MRRGGGMECHKTITIELTTKAVPHKLVHQTCSPSSHQPSGRAMTGFTKVCVVTVEMAHRARLGGITSAQNLGRRYLASCSITAEIILHRSNFLF